MAPAAGAASKVGGEALVAPPPPPLWHGTVAGICSTVVSRLVIFPTDTVKARLQVQSAEGALGSIGITKQILVNEGLPGFYRGFVVLVLSCIPANMCYFSGYEFGKRYAPTGHALATDVFAAGVAQGIAGVVYCPVDVIKQSMQTNSLLEAAAAKAATGGVSGNGAGGVTRSVAGGVSGNAAAKVGGPPPLSKGVRGPGFGPSGPSGPPSRAFHAAPFAATATSTSPAAAAAAARHPVSVPDAVRAIVATNGVRGLWRGFLTMNALWMPWNMLYIPTYESLKMRWYRAVLARRDAIEAERAARLPSAARLGAGAGADADAAASSAASSISTLDALLGVPRAVEEIAAYEASVGEADSGGSGPSGPSRAATLVVPSPTHEGPPIHHVLPPWAFPACSATGAAGASLLTHPIDVIKTRVQVLSTSTHLSKEEREKYLTPSRVAKELYEREGLAGFARGLGARIVTTAVSTAVSWYVYESVKAQLADMEERGDFDKWKH